MVAKLYTGKHQIIWQLNLPPTHWEAQVLYNQARVGAPGHDLTSPCRLQVELARPVGLQVQFLAHGNLHLCPPEIKSYIQCFIGYLALLKSKIIRRIRSCGFLRISHIRIMGYFRLGYVRVSECPAGLKNWPCRIRALRRGQKQKKSYCEKTKKSSF